MYLTLNRMRYVVVHTDPFIWFLDEKGKRLAETGVPVRVRSQLEPGKVFEDERATVYDRERLGPPKRTVLMASRGWIMDPRRRIATIGKFGWIAVYNPDPDQEWKLTLKAMAGPEPWPMRLKQGDKTLARRDILPGEFRTYTSPPIPPARGLQEFVVK